MKPSRLLLALIGGLLAEWFGWRATLLALTVMGAITLFVVARYFQETLHERHPEALQPAVLLRTARGIELILPMQVSRSGLARSSRPITGSFCMTR